MSDKKQVKLIMEVNKEDCDVVTTVTSDIVNDALGYTPMDQSLKGANLGVSELDANGKVVSSQLPSYVDDVIEGYLYNGSFYKESSHTTKITGETGKIYIDLSTGKTYRWSGSIYTVISETLALGETSSTAYRGDRGKIAYDHSQTAHAPSNAEKNQNAFANVKVGDTTIVADNTSDTLTLTAGDNITITPDATTDSVTISATDTTYEDVTDTESGLMSPEYKSKLDGIAVGANNYTLPLAGTTLGGVKSGGDVTISSGVISVNDDSHNHVISNIDGLQNELNGKSPINHSHLYAGSSEASGAATSANKLNTNAGSATNPVYFSNGVPVKTTYTLGKSVPSNALFTDTVYTHPSYTAQSSGLYKITVDATGHVSNVKAVAKSDITALGIPSSDTNTHYTSKNVVNSSNTATSNTTTALSNGNVYLISVENGAVTSAHKISGSGATTVTTDSSGNIVISSTDTKYTHPTTSGNKHIPSGGSSGQILRWSANGTAVWGADNNTDTKVNVTLGTTTKAYLLGTSTTPTSTATGVTAISDTGVYLDTTAGKLTATTFSGALSGNASTATKLATARTISLGSGLQGSTTFDGSANVTLSGSLKRCYFVDSNSNWNRYPWFKIADVTSTAANEDANITFLVTCGWTTTAMGILRARIRSNSTVGTYGGGNLTWELLTIDTNYINPSNFVMVYTSTSGTSLKAELWVKNTAQYNSYMFTVLDESTRSSFTNKWNIYTNPTHVSSYTSGTGTITSTIVSILNNSATATALTTSAGSATRPVYFSDGKPKVCDYTLGAACARNVTTASNKTHTSFGTNNNYVPDMAFLSYWNGAYSSSGASNLSYCTKGAFGDAAIKGVDTTATSGSTNLITSGAMYTALAGKAASSHTHSYLPLSGGTISSSSYGPLTIERSGSTNAAGIVFKNSNGKLGSIAMTSTGADGLIRYTADSTRYDILDTGNAFTTTAPKANGTAAAGSATTVSRSDHVHPLQTSVSGSSGSCTGNAATATKWATARNINGLSVDGTANRANYGTCSTAAATQAKIVNCSGFALITGSEITVKFTVTNTASNPTLNVNGTGNKAIKYRGSNITAGYLAANRTYTFRYDGTNYDLVGDINTDTDTKVTQKNSTANASLRLLLSYSSNDTGSTNTVNKSANFLANPSTGCLTAKMFKGTYVLLYDSAISGSTATVTITNLWNYSILFVTIFDIEGGMGRVDKYPIAIQKLNASTSNAEVVRYFDMDGTYTNYTDYFIKFQKSSTANSLSVSTSGVDKIGKLRIEALI